MSAFVVSAETVDHVVTAIARNDTVAQFLVAFNGWDRRGMFCADRLDQIGRTLFDLNVRAVAGRYPGQHDLTETGRELAESYRWNSAGTYYPRDRPLVVLCIYAKAIECLAYQCSEDATIDDPLLAELRKLKTALASQIVSELPEYEAAPWDFPQR